MSYLRFRGVVELLFIIIKHILIQQDDLSNFEILLIIIIINFFARFFANIFCAAAWLDARWWLAVLGSDVHFFQIAIQ